MIARGTATKQKGFCVFLKTSSNKGFTLIELLVVIAIIALLMGVLLPSLNHAKQQARTVYCLNNLKQITLAAHTYTFSNNDYYPVAYYTEKVGYIRYYYSWDFTTYNDWSTNPPTKVVKPGYLWQGQANTKVQQCPSYKGGHNWLADPSTGYNYNTSYLGSSQTGDFVGSARITDVKISGSTVIFGDGQYSGGANKFMRSPQQSFYESQIGFKSSYAGTQGYRHLGRTNVAFCDGHASTWKERYTDTYNGQEELENHNADRDNEVKIGFLSPDNSLYDLE